MTTNDLTPEQKRQLNAVVDGILDAIKVAGDHGAPEGVLYAALMAHGCTLNQFHSIIGAMARGGLVRKAGHLLFAA